MRIVLWDTRHGDIAKDFAGGFGVGVYHGRGGWRGKLIRQAFRRERRPPALAFAYLAAGFTLQGHQVEYIVDRVPTDADVVIFHPALATVANERRAMTQLLDRADPPRVLVCGPLTSTLPHLFDGLRVTLLSGEPEVLPERLDEILGLGVRTIDLGRVGDLDSLPWPDWSIFGPQQFRLGFDFTRFPSALVQASRGCSLACDYCPYLAPHRGRRGRQPAAVVDEIRHAAKRYGFQSFKFRDPLFGSQRQQALELAERLARLARPIQFAVESRSDLLDLELLKALRQAGLTSVTIGVESPDKQLLREHHRAAPAGEALRDWIAACHALGIRTVAGFMIGFPDDTRETINNVLRYAKSLGPTLANFNLVTPYPGTPFFDEIKGRIATFDYSKYTVYQPVLKYDHLSADELLDLHARCFVRYFFRTRWLKKHAPLMWPRLLRRSSTQDSQSAAVDNPAQRVRIDGEHRRKTSRARESNAAEPTTRQ